MKYDGSTYGIIPDDFETILNNYLNPLQNTFPNANSPNDPIYTLAYVTASQDVILQKALQSLWNSLNANTAQGLGLEILGQTVLNLTRKPQTPSYCQVDFSVGPIYSTCMIQMTVTDMSSTGPIYIPSGWTPTGTATPAPGYVYTGSPIAVNDPGVFYIPVTSTDTSTPIPAGNFTGGEAIPTLTFTITNLQPAVLGSITVPTTFQISASSLGANSPTYSPNTEHTYITQGTYSIICYSDNITTPVGAEQLNTFTDSANASADYLSYIIPGELLNPYDAILGVPQETDEQFLARRRYYLNVEGQTYYGMEKAILALNAPALRSLFIEEVITQITNSSLLLVDLDVNATDFPVVIPVGWKVYTGSPPHPSPDYATVQEYSFEANEVYTIPVYSTDPFTVVDAETITSADPPFGTTIISVNNLSRNVLSSPFVPSGFGQRGYKIYLDYPVGRQSEAGIDLVVTAITGGPITVPIGWAVETIDGHVYATIQEYTISTTGVFTVSVYSGDIATPIPSGALNNGELISGLTFTCSNPNPAFLGGFDTNDPYLQQVAEVAYKYHAFGTNFYPAAVGATTFTVPTEYPGYTYDVILNPFQTQEISCNLKLVYNTDPFDTGFTGQVFDTSILPQLKTEIEILINDYFRSKTIPTDLVYTITELSTLIQAAYPGIVALVGNGANFSFGTLSPTVNGLLYLRRPIGFNYHLSDANFNFLAINKQDL